MPSLQLALDPFIINYWIGFPLILIGIATAAASKKDPMKIIGERARNMIKDFVGTFNKDPKNPDYEVKYVIADLRLGFPNALKGSLQVKMTKKEKRKSVKQGQTDLETSAISSEDENTIATLQR